MDILLNDIGRDIAHHIKSGFHWLRCMDMDTSLLNISNALEALNKAHLMLPTLLRYLEGWEEYAKKINQYNERDFFSLYKNIAECAEIASCETINNPDYARDFSDIEYLYRDKMDAIAGVDFTLKIEDE